MKHSVWNGLFVSLAVLSVASCSDGRYDSPSDGTGSVALSLDVNGEIISATPSRSSLDEIAGAITSADFKVRLTSSDGEAQEWNYDEFAGARVKSGVYTLEAFSGAKGEEGFDKAYFAGSTQVTVAPDVTTEAAVTASLANSCVIVKYTEAFTHYMTSYSASVRTEGSTDGLDYPVDATDELFVNPGNTSLYITFTTPQDKTATIKAAEFEAAAQHRYTVTVDVNGGEIGDAVLSVSFDDTTLKADKEITLSDELLNMPAPTVTPAEAAADIIEGDTHEAVMNIVARGGISAARLVTESPALINRGWPSEIDLVKADAATQASLKQMGLKVLGLWKDKEPIMAQIDFSGVIPALPGGTHAFRVEVEDVYGKVSNPSGQLKVNVSPLTFTITGHSVLLYGATDVTLNIDYNGKDINDVKFTYYTDRDTWADAVVNSVTKAGDNKWNVALKVGASSNDLKLRAKVPSLNTIEYTIQRGEPAFAISAAANDIYAKSATLTVSSDETDASSLIPMLKFTVHDGATALTGIHAEKVADNKVRLTGLPSNKALSVTATLTEKNSTANIQTEAEAAIPNGDFETLRDALSANNMNQGGQWSISAGINYQTHQTYSIREPEGWATVNAKTASSDSNPQNSWFVVPSSFNSTLSWTSTVPNIRFIGTGGGTETPASCQGFTANSGSNAMVIRNVGWDANGSVPDVWKKEFAGSDEYYNHTVPTVANASAGKLFLGSYRYSNGSETYNEGVAFTSRPSALTGYYTYSRCSADGSETGKAIVKVMNGSTVIGSGEITLNPAVGYTAFTVPVTYVANAPKATHVRVMLTSSNHASYNQAEETASIKLVDHNSRYEGYKLGAVLTVDNLSFTY